MRAASFHVRSSLLVLACVCVLVGCKPKPAPAMKLAATVSLAADGATESAKIEVDTEPGALVGYQELDGNVKLPDVTTDPKGHAVISVAKIKVTPQEESSDTVSLRVMGMVMRKSSPFSKGQPLVFDGDVKAPRPVHLDDSLHCIGCGDHAVLSWDIDALGVTGFPKGTRFDLGGKNVVLGAPAKSVPFDSSATLAAMTVAADSAGRARFTGVKAPITITLPDGKKLAQSIAAPTSAARDFLAKALAKPLTVVRLGTEGATGGRHGMLVVTANTLDYVGPSSKVAEVDLVAAFESSSRSISCGTYVNSKTNQSTTGSASMNDVNVVVWERRTGKKVAERRFLAPTASCSGVTTKSAGSSTVNAGSSSYDRKAVDAYLASLAP